MTTLRRLLRRGKAFPLCAIVLIILGLSATDQATAQMISPQDLELFRRIGNEMDTGRTQVPSKVDQARDGVFQPQPSAETDNKENNAEMAEPANTGPTEGALSRIEADYASRLGSDYILLPSEINAASADKNSERTEKGQTVLRQFGYEIFEGNFDANAGVTGRLPANYILGIGDELVITLHGSKQGTFLTHVDREGRVALPDIGLLEAGGLTFGEFRDNLRERTKSSLVGTEAFVSVGSLRQITVYIMGEVGNPGVYRMTSLASVVDALSHAGGVRKSGSLRNITVARNGSKFGVDLYDIIQGSAGGEQLIYDGDRIIVPVIGKTVAAVGEVIRPAIYELNGKSENAGQLLELAGGPLRPSGYFVGLKRFEDSGRQSYSVLGQERLGSKVKSGDILSVQYEEDVVMGTVRLEGHVRTPGERPLTSSPTVQTVIADVYNLGDEPYLPFAVIQTTDLSTFSRHYRGINLGGILGGKLDHTLQDRDRLIVLSTSDVEFLSSPLVRQAISSGKAEEGACQGLVRLAQTVADSGSQRFASAVRWAAVGVAGELRSDEREAPREDLTSSEMSAESPEPQPVKEELKNRTHCPKIYDDNEHLLSYLLENVVAITGAVTRPGVYPMTREGSLSLVLSVSGSLTTSADRSRIEVTAFRQSRAGLAASHRDYVDLDAVDPSSINVRPRSSILVPAVPDDQESGVIMLSGEFVRPGPYTLHKGERLSSVVTRAGGLTENAYPYGAIFTRVSVKEEQTQGLRRSIRDLRTALAGASLKPRNASLNLEAAINLADSLEGVELPGRFVVEADPAALAAQPDLDVLVEPGDELFVPKRPTFVSLAGALLNPGTVQFNSEAGAKEYIRAAGGFHETADKGRVFVVLPNGSAAPAPKGKWSNNKRLPIPPGSTIVVPIESAPFDWLTLTKDLTQIFSQLALAAASLSVINN